MGLKAVTEPIPGKPERMRLAYGHCYLNPKAKAERKMKIEYMERKAKREEVLERNRKNKEEALKNSRSMYIREPNDTAYIFGKRLKDITDGCYDLAAPAVEAVKSWFQTKNTTNDQSSAGRSRSQSAESSGRRSRRDRSRSRTRTPTRKSSSKVQVSSI